MYFNFKTITELKPFVVCIKLKNLHIAFFAIPEFLSTHFLCQKEGFLDKYYYVTQSWQLKKYRNDFIT